MSKRLEMVRQGDVLVFRSKAKTKNHVEVPREDGRVVLAHGEVTGHAHAIAEPGACLLRAEGVSDRVLSVGQELVNLVHEEHGAIAIPRGEYVVRQQREYDWLEESSRVVAD